MSYQLGVDVGGTFTDLLLFNESKKEITLAKVPTTPENQAVGIVGGVEKIIGQVGISPKDITLLMHGTTAATNAVLEGKGARTALIVTEGFRDVLHIMRQNRPKLYDFFAKRPLPLVPRHLRFEVSERILYTGEIFKEIDEKKLKSVVRKIKQQKIESVAICLLHSYVNPIHEQKIKRVLLQECPEIFVCASSEILPEIKE